MSSEYYLGESVAVVLPRTVTLLFLALRRFGLLLLLRDLCFHYNTTTVGIGRTRDETTIKYVWIFGAAAARVQRKYEPDLFRGLTLPLLCLGCYYGGIRTIVV